MNAIEARTSRPQPDEYGPFYKNYIAQVTETDILDAMRSQRDDVVRLLRAQPESVGGVRHPPYTWSVKDVVGHITDAERIFGYRALRFARADTTPLPGFDDNEYVRVAGFDRTALAKIVDEFESVRNANLLMFENFPTEAWPRRGEANKSPLSVRALAYIIVGHARHHTVILKKRLGA